MVFDRATIIVALIVFLASCLSGCALIVAKDHQTIGLCMGVVGGSMGTLAAALGTAYQRESKQGLDTSSKGTP